MCRQEFVVALDVGGSLTKITTVERGGRVGAVTRVPTPHRAGSDALVAWVADQITGASRDRPDDVCLGYGVVVPGIIDAASGTVRAAPNVGWYDVPLKDRLAERTGRAGVVGHDVRAGGLAEWRLGAGAGVANLLFLPIGTGIAGAAVVDGRMLEANGYAGEIGHLAVPTAAGLPCSCGRTGCLETVASAAGVARGYALLCGATPGLDAAGVAQRARSGDAAARQAYDTAAQALAEALLAYLTLLGPELVVVGGGMAAAADLFVPQVERALQARLAFQRLPRFASAVLGADAGVIGAGLLGWEHLQVTAAALGETT